MTPRELRLDGDGVSKKRCCFRIAARAWAMPFRWSRQPAARMECSGKPGMAVPEQSRTLAPDRATGAPHAVSGSSLTNLFIRADESGRRFVRDDGICRIPEREAHEHVAYLLLRSSSRSGELGIAFGNVCLIATAAMQEGFRMPESRVARMSEAICGDPDAKPRMSLRSSGLQTSRAEARFAAGGALSSAPPASPSSARSRSPSRRAAG